MKVYMKVEVHDVNGIVHEVPVELSIASWSTSKTPEGDMEVLIDLENGGEIEFVAPDGWDIDEET